MLWARRQRQQRFANQIHALQPQIGNSLWRHVSVYRYGVSLALRTNSRPTSEEPIRAARHVVPHVEEFGCAGPQGNAYTMEGRLIQILERRIALKAQRTNRGDN